MARKDGTTMIVRRSDEAIRDDVIRELQWDSRIDAAAVKVTLADRVVTLTGAAPSYAGKLAAREAAHRVPDVLDVVDDLVVPPSGKSDAELAQAVRDALEWHAHVPAEHIRSTVSMGHVTLEGSVGLLRERMDAEKAVRALHGVRGVQNDIVVDAPRADASAVRSAIEGALARRARHEANCIAVAVDDGVVTLTGPVDSYAEKRAVVGLVSHIPGVVAVRDGLMMRS
jgi:osmotically-inducible protein OsmY